MPVNAQQTPPENPQQGQPLPATTAARLDQLVAAIIAEEEDIERSIERRDENEGVAAKIFSARIDRSGTSMFKNVIALARQLVAERDSGFDISSYELKTRNYISATGNY